MKKTDLGILPFIIFYLIVVVGLTFAAYESTRRYEDQYCKTTPLDRIDRERCGL